MAVILPTASGEAEASESDARESGPMRVTMHAALRCEIAPSTRQLLDALPNLVWVYDRELALSFVNLAGRRLLGLSVGELLGRRDEDLFVSVSTDAYLPTLQLAAASQRRAATGKLALQPKAADARAVDCAITFTPVLDENDQLECLVASVAEPPSAAPELEAKPVTSAQSEELQVAAAGFAHDINNLLTVIGHYQSFVADGSLSPQQSSDLKSAIEATRGGVALAGRLLRLSKGQQTASTLVDANEIVASAARLLRPVLGDAIQLSTDVGEGPLPVNVGVGELEQVIVNLAFNARDAMHSGPLDIRAFSTVVLDGQEVVNGLSPGTYAVIAVKDAGPGIDAKTLARIFDPFFTTKALCGGTGLGLFMVRDVVTRLGGAVRVETTLGRGSEFFIYLPSICARTPLSAPCTQTHSSSSSSSQAPRTQALRPERAPLPSQQPIALLVDNNDEYRESLARLLSDCDMQAVSAKTALAALQIMAQKRVDIVIADHVLPGLDGLQLLDAARSRWPHCQRVLLTRYALTDVVIAAINQCGVSKVLIKSMHPVLMRHELENLRSAMPSPSAHSAEPALDRIRTRYE